MEEGTSVHIAANRLPSKGSAEESTPQTFQIMRMKHEPVAECDETFKPATFEKMVYELVFCQQKPVEFEIEHGVKILGQIRWRWAQST